MAVEIEKFVSAHPEDDDAPQKEKKLGFILSYPVEQVASTSGSAIKWKRFAVNDAVKFAYLYLSVGNKEFAIFIASKCSSYNNLEVAITLYEKKVQILHI